jgi:hypothetical protein
LQGCIQNVNIYPFLERIACMPYQLVSSIAWLCHHPWILLNFYHWNFVYLLLRVNISDGVFHSQATKCWRHESCVKWTSATKKLCIASLHVALHHTMCTTTSCKCIMTLTLTHKCILTSSKNVDIKYHLQCILHDNVAITCFVGLFQLVITLKLHRTLVESHCKTSMLFWPMKLHSFVLHTLVAYVLSIPTSSSSSLSVLDS